jgi:hypothetical protein
VVRRLPVVQSSAPEDAAAEARPAWQWVLIGGGLVFTIWLPLAMVALALGRWLASTRVELTDPEAVIRFETSASASERMVVSAMILVPIVVSLGVACMAGGALVGRFGGRSGLREALLAGVVAACTAWVVALAAGALSPWPVAVVTGVSLPLLAAFFAWLGGRWGLRRRPH